MRCAYICDGRVRHSCVDVFNLGAFEYVQSRRREEWRYQQTPGYTLKEAQQVGRATYHARKAIVDPTFSLFHISTLRKDNTDVSAPKAEFRTSKVMSFFMRVLQSH
jgi:hypothetical protein